MLHVFFCNRNQSLTNEVIEPTSFQATIERLRCKYWIKSCLTNIQTLLFLDLPLPGETVTIYYLRCSLRCMYFELIINLLDVEVYPH